VGAEAGRTGGSKGQFTPETTIFRLWPPLKADSPLGAKT